jgi:predicted lipase
MASTQATKEAIWMTKFMKELRYMKEKKAMVIRCDNQGAISLTKNPTQHARTKHIDVQHHLKPRIEIWQFYSLFPLHFWQVKTFKIISFSKN